MLFISILLVCLAPLLTVAGVAWWIGPYWRPASIWYRAYRERGPRRLYRWHCPPLPVWPEVMARDHPLNRPGVNWSTAIRSWSTQLLTYGQFCHIWEPFFCAKERSRSLSGADYIGRACGTDLIDSMETVRRVIGGDAHAGWGQWLLEMLWEGVEQWRPGNSVLPHPLHPLAELHRTALFTA